MNNIQELIEDLKSIILYFSRNHEGLLYVAYAATIQQTITALESMQAPLPEDIEYQLQTLRWESAIISIQQQNHIADLLERLWRENASLKARAGGMKTLIERCEHHGEDSVLYCPKCRPSHAELQARIKELETIVNCNSVNKMLATLQTENKRLEAALSRIRNDTDDDYWHFIIDKARKGK